jgi:hypothetical protein
VKRVAGRLRPGIFPPAHRTYCFSTSMSSFIPIVEVPLNVHRGEELGVA